MKRTLLVLVSVFALAACNQEAKKETTVTLTQQEKEIANGNPNLGARLLLRKAVIVDGNQEKLTDEEKAALQKAKDNAVADAEAIFYLQNKIGKELKVTQEDVVNFYNANKDKLQNADPATLYTQIENYLQQQQEAQKTNEYYNELIKKYNLNDILKKEFPQKEAAANEKADTTTEQVTPAENTNTTENK